MSREPSDRVPHRYPFRLVERAEIVARDRVAITLASGGGAQTPYSAWPVTLVAEVLAQALLLAFPPNPGGLLRLVAMDRVRLLQSVAAGDRLEIHVAELGALGGLRRFLSRGFRGGSLVAVAEVTVSG